MELVDKIVDLIALIPGTFWGVVIGSLFSISGVMLTNSATNKRLRQQFSHDLQLRIGEREHALRRDVYLAATEAIATSLASLGRFTDLNIPNDELTKCPSGDSASHLSRLPRVENPLDRLDFAMSPCR
jgi:hypothetical protein